MKKFFTNSIAAICAVLFFTVVGNAQTIIWEEQFDGGFNGWTQDTVSASTDSLSWKWTDSANVGPVMINPNPAPSIMSASAANGSAYVNFEYFAYGADINLVPAEPANYGGFVGHLISPDIDMSGVSGPLNIRFTQVGRFLNAEGGIDARSNVSFSSDGGLTWSDYMDCNPGVEIQEIVNGTVTLPISGDFGLQGSSQVKVRFTYASDFYYWMIDDIQIIERQERNMKANDNFFAIAPNYSTPMSQVESFPFLVDIENIGGQTETGVNVNMTITDLGSGSNVYEEDKAYGTITPDSLAENAVFGGFTPAAQLGSYRAVYTVSSDSTDSDLSNNSLDFEFEVTENLFSKEAGNNLGGISAASDNTWAMGNVFYVPNDGYQLNTITLGVSNANALSGQFITTRVLKWEGDLNEDNVVDDDEYTVESFNGYTFDGTEDGEVVKISADLDGNTLQLEKGFHYIILMEYIDVTNQTAFFLTTTDHDYRAMAFATDSIEANRYGTLLRVGADGDLTTGNFVGGYYVPTIRMSYEPVSTEELAEENIVTVFPNPTSDQLNIDLDLVELTNTLDLQIVSVEGKIQMSRQYENIAKDRISFNLRDLPNGSYFVQLTTENGMRSIPFMVAH